jgi:hypothetical protein
VSFIYGSKERTREKTIKILFLSYSLTFSLARNIQNSLKFISNSL